MSEPKGFKHQSSINDRLAMLEIEPSVQPLREWAADLSERRHAIVPYFDHAEGGVNAKILLLHEAPGPMTNADNMRPGSGFISVDNNDQSAEMVWRTRNEFGLHTGVLSWNIVPWYLGAASVKPNASELSAGAAELRRLMELLPAIQVVITSGRYAQKGWDKHIAAFANKELAVLPTWHPSPLSMKQPGKRDELRRTYERAARLVG